MSAVLKVAEQFSDQLWRLNNLYWIVDKNGNKIKLQLNESQYNLYCDLWHRNVILKARQRGFTTFLAIFALDTCVFNGDYSAGIIAHNLDDAKKIFRTKVKFPYDNLPDQIKDLVPASSDRSNEYVFKNNSSISVSTSYRSGTLQFLHVSEFGKIAAKHPEKANEIVTGAFEAVPRDGIIVVESTAEGNDGKFYEVVESARDLQDKGSKLSKLDFKFIFEPWWVNSDYTLDDDVLITQVDSKYFKDLEDNHGIKLSEGQKRWYVAKKLTLTDKMKREYPSTPDEAFEVAVEGAYYADLLQKAKQEGRICSIPIQPSIPIDTFWDLGRNDTTAIWFMQRVGKENHFIDYYENSGESLAHYIHALHDKKINNDYLYGKHYLPHDVEVTELSANKSRKSILEDGGVKPIIVVPRVGDVNEGIQLVRDELPTYYFDEQRCSEGLKALQNYRKEWDEKNATFKSYPCHNWASNGADAIRQKAQGYKEDSLMSSKPLNYNRKRYI